MEPQETKPLRIILGNNTLIASEAKMREWLGSKQFEKLLAEGRFEEFEEEEEISYGTAAV